MKRIALAGAVLALGMTGLGAATAYAGEYTPSTTCTEAQEKVNGLDLRILNLNTNMIDLRVKLNSLLGLENDAALALAIQDRDGLRVQLLEATRERDRVCVTTTQRRHTRR